MFGKMLSTLGLFAVIGMLLAPMVFSQSVPRMGTDELNQRLGEENLVVLDARASRDYDRATTKIAGSLRANPVKIPDWSKDLDKGATIVLYCA